ncbi:MAG: hypothetical protein E7425_06465 [Ruminococcaceae bacterium]|jgi:ABC-2 type transport system permease protein|nr:hypothetical protein [Oscillospiraceae bacterium]
MPSRTSFFNRTVFFSDLRRWWPLTAGYTLLWLLVLPLTRLTELNHDSDLSAWNMRFDALDVAAHAGYWIAFLTGILFATAAFFYLTNARATNGLHALPARRETLFGSHYLAGLVSQLAAQLVAVLLTAEVLASHGAFDLRSTGLMLLALMLPTLFFYSFGVFCLMFTGQSLAAPVFYFIWNFLVAGVEYLLRSFAGNFLYGWAGSDEPTLIAFSPLLKMLEVEAEGCGGGFDADGNFYQTKLSLGGLELLLVYAVVGLVFAALALLVYRARHSEATGDTVAIGWAKPIFKYGVTFCTALALGQLLYYLFFGQYRTSGDYSLPGTLACMAAAGLIGYFAAEMLLKKSVRVWREGWKGAAVVTLVLVLLGVGMSFDLTGYESYVPSADRIEYASFSWYGRTGNSFSSYVKDAETLRMVTDVHRAIAADKARQLSLRRDADGLFDLPGSEEAYSEGSFSVSYRMKDGRFISRSYSEVLLRADELGDPASTAAAMTALYNAPSTVLQRVLSNFRYDSVDPRTLSDLRFTGGRAYRAIWVESDYLGTDERDLSAAEATTVYEAIVRDVAAGHISGSLFGYEREGRSELELYATYLDTTRPDSGENGREARVFTPRITPQMTDTLEALVKIGVLITFD